MAVKKEPVGAAPVVSDKKKALETAMQQIEKMYGKGSIMRYGAESTLNVEAIPTGSLSLDLALGIGGLPRGRIVEIYGPESSGKTTLALHVQRQRGLAGGLRPVDLHDAATGQAADAQRQVEGQRAGGDRLHVQRALRAVAHDRALAVHLLDLLHGRLQCLFLVGHHRRGTNGFFLHCHSSVLLKFCAGGPRRLCWFYFRKKPVPKNGQLIPPYIKRPTPHGECRLGRG